MMDRSRFTEHADVPAVSAEEMAGDAVADEPRRYPSTIGGVFYLLILIVAGLALALVVWRDWRLGVTVLGIDMIVGACLRLILAREDAGMLAVRNKPVDAVILAGLGSLLVYLASDIPG